MAISPSDSPTTRQVDTIHRQRITPTLVNERIVGANRETFNGNPGFLKSEAVAYPSELLP